MKDKILLSREEVFKRLCNISCDHHQKYYAMYSTWFGGIVTDPSFMMVPIDDHMVHRGDGVFEAFKCVNGYLYLLDRHLDRLERSAEITGIDIPVSRSEIISIVKETIKVTEKKDCLVRMFVSRGPGGFSADPSESIGSQLYVVITKIPERPSDHYTKGIRIKTSKVPMKPSFFASVKSCNYLPNVLMSKEAKEANVEFTVSVDDDGNLGEGPTENIGIITSDYAFMVPKFDRVLRGTTVSRMMELAESLVKAKVLSFVGESNVTREEAYRAQEVMMFGTTFDILPVVQFDGKRIGNGQPGPFFKKFLKLLREDMLHGKDVIEPVWN